MIIEVIRSNIAPLSVLFASGKNCPLRDWDLDLKNHKQILSQLSRASFELQKASLEVTELSLLFPLFNCMKFILSEIASADPTILEGAVITSQVYTWLMSSYLDFLEKSKIDSVTDLIENREWLIEWLRQTIGTFIARAKRAPNRLSLN